MAQSYKEMYQSVEDTDELVQERLKMVEMALKYGYKPTARFYKTDRNMVRKWCRRYVENGIDGLRNKSKKKKSYKC